MAAEPRWARLHYLVNPRLRIAAIAFLNPAPLMWDFDHEPSRSALLTRYEVQTMTPAQCAARLHAGAADLGLVPLPAYATTPELLIAPGCVIASKGAIRSILLVVKAELGLEGVRTVAADASSRASLAYLQILFKKLWRVPARFVQHAPDLDRMLEAADAALLIGDPALLALEDRAAREARTGQRLDYLDLGAIWREWTGVPWVSAVWGVRSDALPQGGSCHSPEARRLTDDLLASRDHGLARREDLVAEWAARIPVPATVIRSYLTENIHYVLDTACIAGIEKFFSLAADCDLLPATSRLRFLQC